MDRQEVPPDGHHQCNGEDVRTAITQWLMCHCHQQGGGGQRQLGWAMVMGGHTVVKLTEIKCIDSANILWSLENCCVMAGVPGSDMKGCHHG